MVEINRELLPVKAHYFFFMAAMGPIYPQITVYGKQLGIEPKIMGYVTSVLPIMYVLTKPLFGFLADYFVNFRKFIFVCLIVVMSLAYAALYFLPTPYEHIVDRNETYSLSLRPDDIKECNVQDLTLTAQCSTSRLLKCQSKPNHHCFDMILVRRPGENSSTELCFPSVGNLPKLAVLLDVNCTVDLTNSAHCLYHTWTFWMFVVLTCIGMIFSNVVNSISDAICFDVLGERQEMKYGAQRLWGTIGYGVSALIAGVAVKFWTIGTLKSFTPALIIMLVFSSVDLLSVSKLNLPKFSSSESIFRDVWGLLSEKAIPLFLVFVIIAGIIDSFIIYFMFWHLEDVATATGYTADIKLIEGCVVAAECLCSEILVFFYSGKILKKIGYVHCLSLCFFMYAVRLGLISIIPNPWWLVLIELVMQGCTFPLCYTCIVAYTSAVAPPGTSATVQGLVAGMDDGLGFAIGSLIGGQIFAYFGGRRGFQIFAGLAFVTCIAHILIRPADKRKQYLPKTEYQLPVEMQAVEKS